MESPFSGQISPELVLVSSPEDARWAREQLPEPGPTVIRRPRTPLAPLVDVQGRRAVGENAAPKADGPRARRVVANLVYVPPVAALSALAAILAVSATGLTPKTRPFFETPTAPAATVAATASVATVPLRSRYAGRALAE